MFTGIVEEIGLIKNMIKGPNSLILHIKGRKVLEGTIVGDSIAVNGVCLTVTKLFKDSFFLDVMHESINASTVGRLKINDRVNLERAMALDRRFGGHVVLGHVDGIGIIKSIKNDDNAVLFQINAPSEVMKYIVYKGSVTIDGASLTVAKVGEDDFYISLIPHTLKETILSYKKPGDFINIETDILARYIEKLMNVKGPDAKSFVKEGQRENKSNESKITMEYLNKYGF